MKRHKILYLTFVFWFILTLLFPSVGLAFTPITSGGPMTPGKAMTPGEPIKGGTFIIPGEFLKAGKVIEVNGGIVSGTPLIQNYTPSTGQFIVPNNPILPREYYFNGKWLDVQNGIEAGQGPNSNGIEAGQGPNGNGIEGGQGPNGNGIDGGQGPNSNGIEGGQGPNGNGIDGGQGPNSNGIEGGQGPNGNGIEGGQGPNSNGVEGGQGPNGNGIEGGQGPNSNGVEGGQGPSGNGMDGGQGPNGNGMDGGQNPDGNGLNGGNSGNSGNFSAGDKINANNEDSLFSKITGWVADAKDYLIKGNELMEGTIASIAGFSFKELDDGRYRIEGNQRFKDKYKFFEQKYYSYLQKFEDNNIFLKNRNNGESILRSSKKIAESSVDKFKNSNLNFFKSMGTELKDNWSFTGNKFWSPKEWIKGNGVTNVLLSVGGTLFDYTVGGKGKILSSDFFASLSTDVTIGIGTAAVSAGSGLLAAALAGAATGSVVPGIGTVVGAVVGIGATAFLNNTKTGEKIKNGIQSGFKWAYDGIASGGRFIADKFTNSSLGSKLVGIFR